MSLEMVHSFGSTSLIFPSLLPTHVQTQYVSLFAPVAPSPSAPCGGEVPLSVSLPFHLIEASIDALITVHNQSGVDVFLVDNHVY